MSIDENINNNREFLRRLFEKEENKEQKELDVLIDVVSGALLDRTSISTVTLAQNPERFQQITISRNGSVFKVSDSDIHNLSQSVHQVLLKSMVFPKVIETTLSSVRERCETIFGEAASSVIQQMTALEQIYPLVLELAFKRLFSPQPLTKEEIKNIHDLLSDVTPASEIEPLSSYHPIIVFSQLSAAVQSIEHDPTRAIKQIGANHETTAGVNATFFLKDIEGRTLFVFKPQEGERPPQWCQGIPVGASAIRERLACALNYEEIYSIPYTAYIDLGPEYGIGSAQVFAAGCQSLLNLSTFSPEAIDTIPAKPLQASLLFDIRFGNLDRHLGNLLIYVEEHTTPEVVLIDHGLCLSDAQTDPLKMDQLALPQIMQPWDPALLEYIININMDTEIAILESHGIPPETIGRIVRVTSFIQTAARLAAAQPPGAETILPYDIGLLVLKNASAFWSDTEAESLHEILPQILSLKATLKTSPRAKVLVERKKLQTKYNDTLLSCILGARQDDSTAGRIDYNDSIVGRAQKK